MNLVETLYKANERWQISPPERKPVGEYLTVLVNDGGGWKKHGIMQYVPRDRYPETAEGVEVTLQGESRLRLMVTDARFEDDGLLLRTKEGIFKLKQ